MALPSLLIKMFCFGQFTGVDVENNFYQITIDGFTLDVPVNKNALENPPSPEQHGLVVGNMKTFDSNGRVYIDNPVWQPITDEKDWPKDGILTRFQGLMTIEKSTYGDEKERHFRLKLHKGGFNYSALVEEEIYNRFPTGDHVVRGKLTPDTLYNSQYNSRRSVWRCEPLGIVEAEPKEREPRQRAER